MITPLTPERLAEIEARFEAAEPTDGWAPEYAAHDDEWQVIAPDPETPGLTVLVAENCTDDDAALIAHAPTDLRDLLAEVRRLREALEKIANLPGEQAYVAGGALGAVATLVYMQRLAAEALSGGKP